MPVKTLNQVASSNVFVFNQSEAFRWYVTKKEAMCLRSLCVWLYLAAIIATFTIQAMICPPNVFTWRVHKQIWSYSLYYNDQNV